MTFEVDAKQVPGFAFLKLSARIDRDQAMAQPSYRAASGL